MAISADFPSPLIFHTKMHMYNYIAAAHYSDDYVLLII